MTSVAEKAARDKRRRMFVRAVKSGHARRASVKAEALASRNSYRAMLGLPLITNENSLMRSGNRKLTKAHDGD